VINLYLVYCIYKLDIIKKLLLLLIGLTVISCGGSDDDVDVEDNPIVGDWSTEFISIRSNSYTNGIVNSPCYGIKVIEVRNEYSYFFSFKSDGTVIQERSLNEVEIQSNGTECIHSSYSESIEASWTYVSGEGQNQTYRIIELGYGTCEVEIRFLPDMSSLTAMNFSNTDENLDFYAPCFLPIYTTLDRR